MMFEACYDSVKQLLYDLYDEYLIVYGPSLNLDVTRTQTETAQPSSFGGFLNLGYSLL